MALLVILASISIALGQSDHVNPNMRSFSSAIKQGTLPANQEKVLYAHDTGQPGVITEQWYTGQTR